MNREDFRMLDNDIIYFDNGATTLKPDCVIDEMDKYYHEYSGNSHRGDYDISLKVDDLFEKAREKVQKFINASKSEEIIWTRGTTESINMIVFGFMKNYLHAQDEVLITETEHASNVLPWYVLEKENHIKVSFIPLNSDGTLSIDSLINSINSNTKVISLAYITNTIGDVRDIKKIIEIAHQRNIIVLVDGAQSVPHLKIDVQEMDIDFLTFSAHKMLGPTGLGVLYGKKEYLEKLVPTCYGGGMNEYFESNKDYALKPLPLRLEAGTMNIASVLGFAKAIDYIENIGILNITRYELYLKEYLVEKLSEVPNVIIYNKDTQSGIVLFNIKGVFPKEICNYLNDHHICVRAGNHCAKMVKNIIGEKNTCRISLYFYNTKEEIDKFIEVIKKYSREYYS